jgi:MSHA pilin protein MshA
MSNQKGFTLIELVVVIVVLGILSAVAVPKFINLKAEAALAAADGIKGAIDSASAINYAAYQVNTTKAVAIGASVTAKTCALAVAALMQDDADISGVSGLTTTTFTGGAGTVESCDFTYQTIPKTAKILLTTP